MPSGRRPHRDRVLRALARQTRQPAAGLTRRQFLKVGALAGASLMLPACVDERVAGTTTTSLPATTTQSTSMRVGVVGAGLAGLTAAYWLDQAGFDVEVFEARERVGGRCWSARDLAPGLVGEHGGEFIDTRHVHLRGMIDILGLELDDTWRYWDNDDIWLQVVDGEVSVHSERHAWMRSAVDGLFTLASQGPLGNGSGPAPLVALDEMTAEEWYRAEVGPTDDGNYHLWATQMTSWFGLDPDRLGGGPMVDYYTVDYPGDDERYTVRGGNDQVPLALAGKLPDGAITLEAPLAAVADVEGQVELELGNGNGARRFDRVVLAVPFTTLRDVDLTRAGLAPTMQAAIDELAMGTNSKVLLHLDMPLLKGSATWSGSLTRADAPRFETWESSSTDDPGGNGLLTVYNGGRAGASLDPAVPHGPASATIVDGTLAAIEPAVPGITAAFAGDAWLDSWVDDPWARGSYAAFGPGQTTRFWGALGAAQGSIHMAGEQTSTFSQGFLNGGVESGCRAASEIMEAAGVPLPPALAGIMRSADEFAPVPAYR